MKICIFSFGFKHGYPEAEYVWDLRFLPNPYWQPLLRPFPGTEPFVAAYVLDSERGRQFLALLQPLLIFVLDALSATERQEVRFAFGCTGGRHRSVAVAAYIEQWLQEKGYAVECFHRDIEKN